MCDEQEEEKDRRAKRLFVGGTQHRRVLRPDQKHRQEAQVLGTAKLIRGQSGQLPMQIGSPMTGKGSDTDIRSAVQLDVRTWCHGTRRADDLPPSKAIVCHVICHDCVLHLLNIHKECWWQRELPHPDLRLSSAPLHFLCPVSLVVFLPSSVFVVAYTQLS